MEQRRILSNEKVCGFLVTVLRLLDLGAARVCSLWLRCVGKVPFVPSPRIYKRRKDSVQGVRKSESEGLHMTTDSIKCSEPRWSGKGAGCEGARDVMEDARSDTHAKVQTDESQPDQVPLR